MRAPNMAAITASLERSLQNCSLSRHRRRGGGGASSSSGDGIGRSSSSDDLAQSSAHNPGHDDAALELNSHISLPYHWEQCLDLTTGEIYYINWRNGTKAKEDPRLKRDADEDENDGGFYSTDESSYDSEESSSESSHSTSRTAVTRDQQPRGEKDHVLVVAGCKICLMYFMLPKQVEDCPKCGGQLLHFDRSDNVSGSP
ncbi:uncharacterized protein LOC104414733 [Eucalyptus grandis]|uniref:Uncharacterized protein n=2 Tax=Eucalyptus grandis TaxID=71139 RepID=A0ACC3JX10_EUCGR|nr:uncharacterized protein LOC104414733 [Eucalyptus grandis]KAK3418813.1 hypothetical protein EUGRSUZ_H03380 [Eucalyptus grandis]